MPAGAIEIDPGHYMVPIGRDASGCEQFRPLAPGRMTVTAIHYRTADGAFVLDRNEAACAALPPAGPR